MDEKFIQVYKAYDESLNEADARKYSLSIQISTNGFSFTIFDPDSRKYLSMESCESFFGTKPKNFVTAFRNYYHENNRLQWPFASVNVLYETTGSTLVPEPLFNTGHLDLFAKFNFRVPEDYIVSADRLHNPDTYLVYGIPQALMKMMDELFPSHIHANQTGKLIGLALLLGKNLSEQKHMIVNVSKNLLDIVVTEGKDLLFANTFTFKSKEDFVYYLIFVLEQLSINPSEIEIGLAGKIDKTSGLFEIIYKYIKNVRFLKRSESFRYSYIFNTLPDHQFYTLLNYRLCE